MQTVQRLMQKVLREIIETLEYIGDWITMYLYYWDILYGYPQSRMYLIGALALSTIFWLVFFETVLL